MLLFGQCSGFVQKNLLFQDVYKIYPSLIQDGKSPEIQVGTRILCQVIIVTIT